MSTEKQNEDEKTDPSTFTCSACGKESKFLKQVAKLLLEGGLFTEQSNKEVERRYECEHCGTANDIALSGNFWASVDRG